MSGPPSKYNPNKTNRLASIGVCCCCCVWHLLGTWKLNLASGQPDSSNEPRCVRSPLATSGSVESLLNLAGTKRSWKHYAARSALRNAWTDGFCNETTCGRKLPACSGTCCNCFWRQVSLVLPSRPWPGWLAGSSGCRVNGGQTVTQAVCE